MDKQYKKLRFAPSPTGYLHIGGARTCLFSWLYARKIKADFVLRIEDTDLERSKDEYLDEILKSIEWLGMDWDEIFYQSKRFEIYREYAEKLISQGKAYKKDGAVFFKYDFKSVEIEDLVRGKIIFTELPKDEEVIIKSDGSPTYNFSCALDDALMGIDCVVRGEDHISNTPKQILMYKALGFNVPDFAHLPLILSPDGGRMSKRHGATAISEYESMGYLPEAVTNYLLLLGWSPGNDREIFSIEEAKDIFDIKRINKTGAAFSLDKLNWMNGEYIRAKDIKVLTEEIQSYLENKKFLPSDVDKAYVEKVCGLFQERTVKLSDLIEKTRFCFYDDFKYTLESEKILDLDLTKELKFLSEKMNEVKNFNKEDIEKAFRGAALELDVKLKVLVHPTRVALTGSKDGPGLFETMELLGKAKVVQRLNKLIEHWAKKS